MLISLCIILIVTVLVTCNPASIMLFVWILACQTVLPFLIDIFGVSAFPIFLSFDNLRFWCWWISDHVLLLSRSVSRDSSFAWTATLYLWETRMVGALSLSLYIYIVCMCAKQYRPFVSHTPFQSEQWGSPVINPYPRTPIPLI